MSQSIFQKNPSLREYFETTDGQKFFTLNAAQNHARSQKQSIEDIKHVERNKIATEPPVSSKKEAPIKKLPVQASESSKAEAPSKKEKPLNKMNKSELEVIAKALNLSLDGLTNAQAVEAIKDAQKSADEGNASEASNKTSEGDTSAEANEASEAAPANEHTEDKNSTNVNND